MPRPLEDFMLHEDDGPLSPRSLRVPRDLWDRAMQKAAERREPLTAALVRFLRAYSTADTSTAEWPILRRQWVVRDGSGYLWAFDTKEEAERFLSTGVESPVQAG